MRNVKLQIYVILIIMSCATNAADTTDQYYEKIIKQIEVCEIARSQIGSEMKYVVLSGLQDIENNECQISLIFKTKDDMEKFKQERIAKGLSPTSTIHKENVINFSMSLGDVVPE